MEMVTYVIFLLIIAIAMVVIVALCAIGVIDTTISFCKGIRYHFFETFLRNINRYWPNHTIERILGSEQYRSYRNRIFEDGSKPEIDVWSILWIPLLSLVVYSVLFWAWKTYPYDHFFSILR